MRGIGRSMARSVGQMLDQRATVYIRTGSAGFTTVAQTGLRCLLQQGGGASPGPQRADQVADAQLFWDPAYEMPEPAQIEVNVFGTVRWNVIAGSVGADVAPGPVTVMRHASLIRAK